MASSHYMLQRQTPLINRMKTMINQDLKDICKAHGYQVSGNKATLQSRCIEILRNYIQKGDAAGFSDIEYRVNNHGKAPHPASSSSTCAHTNGGSGSYHSTPSAPSRPAPANSRASPTGRCKMSIAVMPEETESETLTPLPDFKPSPFYEILDVVLPLHDLLDMPHNRHTVNAKLVLTPEQVQRMRDDTNVRLLLYCGVSSGMSTHNPIDIAFPNQLEVKINSDDLKHNFKGLKNKPGSTKPADVTDRVRKNAGYQNQVSVTYALTTKRYSFIVYMARYISAESLIERIKTGKKIPKQSVLDEMNRANADPDIAATSVRMSLKDPVSTTRISLPVRSTRCTHNQCFDGAFFLQLQEQAPQWSCPVCNKDVPFESLCVDKYFEDILQRTSTSIEKVDIEPNGEWQVIKEEEEDSQPNFASRKRARASYDDDFDDDGSIEVMDSDPPPTNGNTDMARPLMSSAASALPGFGLSLNTPPASSREPSIAQSVTSAQRPSNKRPASAVIDLTLSDDDEDEPPRPAKRQSTSARHGTSSQSLHLPPQPALAAPHPAPLPPPDARSSYHHSGHTDMFRPTNGSGRAPSVSRNNQTEQTGLVSNMNGESVRQGHSASPTIYNRANGGFPSFGAQPPSRPITSGSGRTSSGPRFPGFALRTPSQSDAGLPEQQQQQHLDNMLLSHMHPPNPPGFYEQWHNDYGNYSSSPPG